jgi:farnesyl-diphosphate farnesyltransferase
MMNLDSPQDVLMPVPDTTVISSPLRRLVVDDGDARFLSEMLAGTSRTFALTIPRLPASLRWVVGDAYLLCRIADTIEDEPGLDPQEKNRYHRAFRDVVAGRRDAAPFVDEILPRLSQRTTPAERALMAALPKVVTFTQKLMPPVRASIERTLEIMCEGMPRFQRHVSLDGLEDVDELDRYCYYVAGVVGEMLTDLFCLYDPRIEERRSRMAPLAVSFGLGLQMTNILKDFWEDRAHGVCWFPRDVFARHDCNLSTLEPRSGFDEGVRDLIARAHRHLHRALAYTLCVPSDERGIREFCLWAIGYAVFTLRKLAANLGYRSGDEVKISRRSVRTISRVLALTAGRDRLLRMLFSLSTRSLPLADEESVPCDVTPSLAQTTHE